MKLFKIKWQLVLYDALVFFLIEFFLRFLYLKGTVPLTDLVIHASVTFVCLFAVRIASSVYKQIWRYGGVQCYIRLVCADACAFGINFLVVSFLPIKQISLTVLITILSLDLLAGLSMRMCYRYAYKSANQTTQFGRLLSLLLRVFAGIKADDDSREAPKRIRIAIAGAGDLGVSLAQDLLSNNNSTYIPKCFIDVSRKKTNRSIYNLPVLMEEGKIFEQLDDLGVQEVVFAISHLDNERKKDLYGQYLRAGYKIKVYDYPEMQDANAKPKMREFDIEELLFRKPVVLQDERTCAYYRGKTILITGGGGSIGSELCRQLSAMEPEQVVIVDIYENGAYDVQQELKIKYGDRLKLQIEIASITNHRAMARIFETYHPQIVINAAAHKHVPLMEHNCIEAVENNVFGTKLLVDLCEQYEAERFMMVSTDKAVNPTNVMGATKRMCEMIVQSASTCGRVKYSATRFGNVLGSAGSVIPLFKKQIASGGPITLTDKRIIRYFMTIPEASSLVLQSGAMAENGDLFVLDMGQPVKILDLAQSMIRLAGISDIAIVETGLRPGEKLYEELLVKTEELDKTENQLIFIERDTPCSQDEMAEKLFVLKKACASEDDEAVRNALHETVPTYRPQNEVNATAEQAEEMKLQEAAAVLQ